VVTISTWLGFVATVVVAATYPGVGALFVVGTGLRHGFGRSAPAVMGMQVALLSYVAMVGFGLAVVLNTSPQLFSLIKWSGVIYLLWLGVQKLRSDNNPLAVLEPRNSGPLFLQGFLANFTNPKAIIFMAALFPQFISAASPLGPQLAILAVTMFVIDTAVMSGYAWLGSRLITWMKSERRMKLANRLSAGLLIVAAICMASIQH
jgi:homoserine/homoserine lactone efflux protein